MQLLPQTSLIKKISTSVIALILIGIGNISIAQTPTSGDIKGRLIDSETHNAIEFATVSLESKTSGGVVSYQTTMGDGLFAFKGLKWDNYQIKVSLVGYQAAAKENIELSIETPVADLGDWAMQTLAQQLGEVNVVGERLKGEAQVDRMVYNINQSVLKTSNSGLDLLKRIPTLQVDGDNKLTLEGSSNILIFVDGKQASKEYVYSLNPQMIEKIETINNPSSKYDASITGVVNIVLKHDALQGGALGVNAQVPLSETYNSENTIAFTSSYKKLTVDVNLYSYLFNRNTERSIERESWVPDTTQMLQVGTEHQMQYKCLNPSLTLGYFFNKKNVLHLYVQTEYLAFNKTQDMSRTEKSYEYPTVTELNYISDKGYDWAYNYNEYSLFYIRKFDRPETELTADLTYSTWHDKGDDFNEDWLVPDLSTSEVRNFTTKNHENVLFSKLDYTTKIFTSVKLETGYAFSNQQLDNNLTGDITAYDNSVTYASDSLQYDETRNAVYLSLSGSVNKLSWMGGMRFENSDITINSTIKSGYNCLLPNISLQQKLESKNSLKLSYRRRINRPQSYHLNSFLKQNEKMTYEQGDPSIRPSLVNSFKFSYTYYVAKSMIIPQLYYNYYQDNINRISTISDDGIITKSFKNGGDGYDYGVEISGQLQLFKWWTLNPYVSFGEACVLGLQNEQFNIEPQNDWIWATNLSSVMTFRNDFTIVADFNYRSPYIAPQSYTYRDPSYSIKVEKGFLKNSVKIGLLAQTPFVNQFIGSKVVTEVDESTQHFKQTDETKFVFNYRLLLMLSYNLKWGQMENEIKMNRGDVNAGRGGGF